MAKNNKSVKGRIKPYEPVGNYFQLEHWIVASEEFGRLPGSAVRLLLAFIITFNGKNNGDLEMTWEKLHRKHGWTCKRTFIRALKRLRDFEWIVKTRQGGRDRCCLYALTFLPIDDCGGKLDAGFEKEDEPSHKWVRTTSIPKRKSNSQQSSVGDIECF